MPQHHFVGDRDSHRSLFDDKIACMANTMYPMPAQAHLEVLVDKKLAWAKTNRNYFISKAAELEMILKYVGVRYRTGYAWAHRGHGQSCIHDRVQPS